MFHRLEVKPAYKVVCEEIERQIVGGRLRPGDLLPTETALAAQFGLTRHTVREGLRQLEEGGLVGRAAGRRLVVKTPHHSELVPRATRLLRLQGVTFRELYAVAILLEPEAARAAAPRATPAQLAALEENLQEMEAALAAGRPIVALDIAFHAHLAAIAGNMALTLAREPVSELFFPALQQLFDHPSNREVGPRRLAAAHGRIIAALRAGDAEEAGLWMHRHIADFKRGYDLCGLDLDAPLPSYPGAD